MTKKFKNKIRQFVADNVYDIEDYKEYEYKIIKTHPKFDQNKWDEWMVVGDITNYDATVQKMIKWAHKQIIAELFK
jgi:hypothetical protein